MYSFNKYSVYEHAPVMVMDWMDVNTLPVNGVPHGQPSNLHDAGMCVRHRFLDPWLILEVWSHGSFPKSGVQIVGLLL